MPSGEIEMFIVRNIYCNRTIENVEMKKALMIISAMSAIACLVLSIISDQMIFGILSSLASFVLICIWFLDFRESKEQSENMKELQSKTENIEGCLTWKEFD